MEGRQRPGIAVALTSLLGAHHDLMNKNFIKTLTKKQFLMWVSPVRADILIHLKKSLLIWL